jgi:hypothetical protein
MSNTSKGRGEKGSKFWMQTLIEINNGKVLTKEIQKKDSSIGDITWISPLKEEEYIEYKLNNSKIINKFGINNKDMDFWPEGQPQWDAIGIAENDNDGKRTIILIEAKSHLGEMNTLCTAKSDDSKILIEKTLKETYENLTQNKDKEFNKKIWMGTYYQLANRLAFLYKLRENRYNVKLVLLNIVNDPTHEKDKQVSEEKWKKHYEEVFSEMLSNSKEPDDVIILNSEISIKWS